MTMDTYESQSTSTPDRVPVGSSALCFAELRGIIGELNDLSYDMLEHAKADDLCGIIEKFQAFACRVAGHAWVFDQCGYWQHQYCIECGAAKYPDMAKRRCGELDREMGGITEDEFISANDQAQAPAAQNSTSK